jgi:hypothetical protein
MSHYRQTQTEPSSWWPFVSMALGAVGAYMLLVVHLVLEAAGGRPWTWALMAVPTAFFFAAALTLAIGTGIPVRERLASIPAALLGYSPRAPKPTRRSRAVASVGQRSAKFDRS